MSHEVSQSGFFSTVVQGHLRPSAQIVQWNIAGPDPSGFRHVESGGIKRFANENNRGGFTAQQESGSVINFGSLTPASGSGFWTDTVALTFNFGLINENSLSRFDKLWDNGSGTAAKQLTGFNFRFWVGTLSAFDTVSKSGNDIISGVRPTFYYRESAQWRRRYTLELNDSSGNPVSGVLILPSSMPTTPNINSRENDISISGSFKDREFTNFIYTRAFFPQLPFGHVYKLGTYGGLGENTFRLKFSYDYTALDAHIINPQDLDDDPVD